MIFFVLFVASCSAQKDDAADNAANAEAFDYFATYEVNEINYSIYLPSSIDSAVYYTHEKSNINSDSTEWVVNFIYEPTYHVDEGVESKEVWTKLYEKLAESENVLEEKCNIDLMLFDPYTSVELEFALNNQNNKESSYVTLITYLPIRIYNESTRRTVTVGVPVNVSVLLEVGVTVK